MGLRKKIKKNFLDYLLHKEIFSSRKVKDSLIFDLLNLIKPKKLSVMNVRIGGNNDGGYVIPNDLENIKYCFSAGVGSIYQFENELSKMNIKSFLADYSVNPKISNPLINFEKIFIGSKTYKNFITLKDWISKKINYYDNEDLILQMDVEGDEYEILQSIDIATLKKFRIILIEFHNLHYLFDHLFFKKFEKIFLMLMEYYYCSHIHPNNDVDNVYRYNKLIMPSVMEFSFLRKDRARIVGSIEKLPSVLDRPNNPNKNDIILPKYWFR
jgi:hypothetical protein